MLLAVDLAVLRSVSLCPPSCPDDGPHPGRSDRIQRLRLPPRRSLGRSGLLPAERCGVACSAPYERTNPTTPAAIRQHV